MSDTDNDAIIDALITAAEPDQLADGQIYGYKLQGGVKVVDLDTAQYAARRERPRSKTGTVVVRDVASFAHYHAKHADTDTEIYTDLDNATVTAVLNAHQPAGDAPRWGDHRLMLELTETLPWKRWTEKDRKSMSQVDMADFLEDNLVDIADEPVPAATMLQVAAAFQATTKGSFSSKYNPSSGATSLTYEEEIHSSSSGGGKQPVAVPEKFAVLLSPFDDVDLWRMEARLRFRIESGRLKLSFVLDRPQDARRAAILQVVDKVEAALNPGWVKTDDGPEAPVRVMRGTPAAAAR